MRALGTDCRFVALGLESQPAEAPLILTSLENMERAAWWRQWRADAVLIYSWAAPRYVAVARAIHEAGCRLVVRLDTDGVTSPRKFFKAYFDKTYCDFRERHKPAAAFQALAKSILFRLRPELYDHKVLRHLGHADYALIESPLALERYQKYLAACGAPELGAKLRVIAHPVAEFFRPDPSVPKEPRLLAVGRWESIFKDTPLMVRTLVQALRRAPEYRATIIGSGAEIVERLLAQHGADVRARIDVRPRLPQSELVVEYRRAQIIVVSSRSESFHIAAASALCCGCSVAGPDTIPSLAWFASEEGGTLAGSRSADALADAVVAEITAWRNGWRDPKKISARWMKLVTVEAVARQCMELTGGKTEDVK